MKKILIIILCLWSVAKAQTVGQFRYDTTKFLKVGGYNEVKIQNSTMGVTNGVLTNVDGNGWGKWVAPAAIVANEWHITGNAGTTAANFLGTTDAQSLRFKINNGLAGLLDINGQNTAFGEGSLSAIGIGTGNTAIGTGNSISLSSGSNNTGVGYTNLNSLETGTLNSVFGYGSMTNSVSGSYNTIIGAQSGVDITTGHHNTFVGDSTGFGPTTGSNNTIIGARVTGLSSSIANNIILSDGAGTIRQQFNSSGALSFNGSSFGSSGQILQSNGSAAIPTWVAAPTGTVTGTGTQNYVSKFNNAGGTAIGNSQIFDNGTNVGIANTNTAYKFDVTGTANISSNATIGGTLTQTGNGAVSAPSITGTGTWYSGGSSTTTKPYLLIEPTGTTSTAWSTAGTGLGINAASGFTGNLIDIQRNGASKLKVDYQGLVTLNNNVNTANVSLNSVSSDLLISNISATSSFRLLPYLTDIYFDNTITGATHFRNNSNGSVLETMLINSGGNISIGNTNNTYKLDVTGTANVSSTLNVATSVTSPLDIGGTTTTSSKTYKTTTGVGTTGADHIFQVGNNGATEAMRILNNGKVSIPHGSLITASNALLISVSSTSTNLLNDYGINLINSTSSANNYNTIGFGRSEGDFKALIQAVYVTSNAGTTDLAFTTSNSGTSEKMRILGNGNVGIGTTSPGAKLEVVGGDINNNKASGSGAWQLGLQYAGSTKFGFIANTSGEGQIYSASGGYFPTFYSNGAEAMRINTSGNVGIGTTSPSARLHTISTTEQLRLGYDASNYISNTVSSAGVLTISPTGASITVTKPIVLQGYTVATLPTGVTGMTAYVTDATAPTYNAALVGGGAVVVPVFYNGAAWVSH